MTLSENKVTIFWEMSLKIDPNYGNIGTTFYYYPPAIPYPPVYYPVEVPFPYVYEELPMGPFPGFHYAPMPPPGTRLNLRMVPNVPRTSATGISN